MRQSLRIPALQVKRLLLNQQMLVLFTLLLVAAVPRLLGLEHFITLDEYLWLDRSRNFLQALLDLDAARTFQTGHPGVTTMWSGALGLWLYGWRQGWLPGDQFMRFLNDLTWQNQPADLLPYMRSGLVLSIAVCVPAVYFLTRRLAGAPAALAAALLLAFDPWLLGHSRILHHDALAAFTMMVAMLALLNFFLVNPNLSMLVFSGATAGVAILTKDLAAALVLWAVCVFILAYAFRSMSPGHLLRFCLIWATALIAVVFLLWPVMWLEPVGTVAKIMQMISIYAQNPHEMGQLWFGRVVDDPGPAFYLVAILYIASPLVLGGVAVWLVAAWRQSQTDAAGDQSRNTALLLLLFVSIYLLLITLGVKKHLRYLLPALAALNIVAGMGLGYAYGWLERLVHAHMGKYLAAFASIVLTSVLILQLAPEYPYYFTYFSPIAGGGVGAARNLSVGAGEGLDLAASYLNHRTDIASLRVVSSLPNVFAPFFKGYTADWAPDTMAFAADYVVIYRFQAQLGLPNQIYLDHITAHWPLVYTAMIGNVPYAWVYEAPAADWVVGADVTSIDTMPGSSSSPPHLLAYKWQAGKEDTMLAVHRLTDRCPAWQVRTRMNDMPWQQALALPPNRPNSVIREDRYVIERIDSSYATALETEIGIANPSCTDVQWWKLPAALFKSQ